MQERRNSASCKEEPGRIGKIMFCCPGTMLFECLPANHREAQVCANYEKQELKRSGKKLLRQKIATRSGPQLFLRISVAAHRTLCHSGPIVGSPHNVAARRCSLTFHPVYGSSFAALPTSSVPLHPSLATRSTFPTSTLSNPPSLQPCGARSLGRPFLPPSLPLFRLRLRTVIALLSPSALPLAHLAPCSLPTGC